MEQNEPHPYYILREEEYKKYVETKGDRFKADYLSWAVCWDKLKQLDTEASYKLHPPQFLPDGTAIVHVELTYHDSNSDEYTHHEYLAVRNYNNKAEMNPDAVQIENSFRRCVAKAVSMATGFGIELWFNEDIRGLEYRKETLLNGQAPIKGQITVDQNVKLYRLGNNRAFKGTDMAKQITKFITSNPSEKEAQEKTVKLEKMIKESKNA